MCPGNSYERKREAEFKTRRCNDTRTSRRHLSSSDKDFFSSMFSILSLNFCKEIQMINLTVVDLVCTCRNKPKTPKSDPAGSISNISPGVQGFV